MRGLPGRTGALIGTLAAMLLTLAVATPTWKTAALWAAQVVAILLVFRPERVPAMRIHCVVPQALPLEHVTDGRPCWCDPEIVGNLDEAAVIVHRSVQ